MKLDRRYGVLRAFALLMFIAAWVCLVLGVAASAAAFLGLASRLGVVEPGAMTQFEGNLATAASILFSTLIVFVMLMGSAQLVRLFIDLEENTRRAAQLLEGRRV